MDQTILTTVNFQPNYKEIFKDMLSKKMEGNQSIIEGIEFEKIKGTLDLIDLQQKLLNQEDTFEINKQNKRLMTYQQKDIIKIMKYKKKHNLTAAEVANKFNVSKSTIFNWQRKKIAE